MEAKLKEKLEALKKQAKEGGIRAKFTIRHGSSLHRIIKTQAQADRLMKHLKSA